MPIQLLKTSPVRTDITGIDDTAHVPVARPASPRLTTTASDFRLPSAASQEARLRRTEHIHRHSFGPAEKELYRHPAFISLLKNREHRAIQVTKANFTEVRRAIQQALLERGEPCVYLNDDSMQEKLTGKGIVRNRQPVSIAGEYDGLLATGGTLIFNHADYAPEGLEAFNEVMTRQMLDGKQLPHHVRILLLENRDDKSRPLTLAQLTRTVPLEMTALSVPAYRDLPPSEPTRPSASTQLIDLQYDPEWRDRLWSSPEEGKNGWQIRTGQINQLDRSRPVLLRCPPPSDPYLRDQVKILQAQGYTIRVEHRPSAAEITGLIANKTAAADAELLLQAQSSVVVCVNSQTLDHVINTIDYIDHDDRPARQRSLIEQITRGNNKDNDGLPLLFISDDMSDTEWMRLMLHSSAFSLAAAAHVTIPEIFTDHVHPLPATPPIPSQASDALGKDINLIHTSDTGLTSRFIGRSESASIIYITKETRIEDLIMSFDVNYDDPDQFVKLHFKPMQLLRDLCDGKLVCIYGLETNPELGQFLASLLHPPHYLFVNGKRLSFADGSLTGRLAVFSKDSAFLQQYRLSPYFADRFAEEANWQNACLFHLVPPGQPKYAGLNREVLEDLMQRVTQISALANSVELGSGPVSLRNFERFDMLCQYLFSQPGQPGFALRSLYQDMLIGAYLQSGGGQAASKQEWLKLGLRMLFPRQMEYMRAHQFDEAAVRQVIAESYHLKDVDNNPWKLLNCLDLNSVRRLLQEACPELPAANEPEQITALLIAAGQPGNLRMVGEKALRVLFDIAQDRDIKLHPLVRRVRDSFKVPNRLGTLAPCSLTAVLSPSTLNQQKAALLSKAGNMVFAEGPPGSGKTHAMTSSQSGTVITQANACEIGTERFNDAIRTWITTPGAELWLDEANLAGPQALAFFQSLLDNGTLILDGVRYALPASNRIKAAGNSASLEGRRHHNFLHAIPTQRYERFGKDDLRRLFLEPMCRHALGLENRPVPEAVETFMQTVLGIHHAVTSTYPEEAFSQRNLEEFTGQSLALLKRNQPLQSPQAYAPYVLRFALEVYGNFLSEKDQHTLHIWLAAWLKIDPDTPAPLDISVDLSHTPLAPTAATQSLCDRLRWRMEAARLFRSYTSRNSTPGESLIIVQGPPAAGKDDAVRITLDSMNIEYLSAVADLKRIDEICEQVYEAYERDIPFILSEINLLGSAEFESRFNNLLTGQAPRRNGDHTAQIRNFCIIGTENAVNLAGRAKRSGALKNRAYFMPAQASEPSETHAIVMCKVAHIRSEAEAKILTAAAPASAGQTGRTAQIRALAPSPVSDMTCIIPDSGFLEEFSHFHKTLLEILQAEENSIQAGPRQITMFLRQVMLENIDWKEALYEIYGQFIEKARNLVKKHAAENRGSDHMDLDEFLVDGWDSEDPAGLDDLQAIFGGPLQAFPLNLASTASARQSTGREDEEMIQALSQAWHLTHPDATTAPTFEITRKYPEDSPGQPAIRYDTERHFVTAHLDDVDELDQLLRIFVSRISHGLPFTDPVSGLPVDNNESADSLQHTLARSEQANLDAPPSFDPWTLSVPKGHGESRGRLGTMSGTDESVFLSVSYRSAAGQVLRLLPGQAGQFNYEPWNQALHGPAITLNFDRLAVNAHNLCHFPTALGKRPVDLRVNNQPVQISILDEFGGWCFRVPPGINVIENMSCKLINSHPLSFEAPATTALFDLTLHPELHAEALALRQKNLGIREVVEELQDLFVDHLSYDKGFTTLPNGNLINALLIGRGGVCQHFAIAASAILQSFFNAYSTYVASGWQVDASEIPVIGHVVTRCLDEQGRIFEADFTVPDDTASSAKEEHSPNTFDKLRDVHWGQIDMDEMEHPDNFDPAMLGLIKRQVSANRAIYNNAGLGRLSASLQSRRAPRPFVKQGNGSDIKYQSIYFADFPKNLPDGMTVSGFAIMLMPAIDALKKFDDAKLPVYLAGSTADFSLAADLRDLEWLTPAKPAAIDKIANHDNVLIIKNDKASLDFLQRLLSHYLETFLEQNDVSLKDRQAVFTCIKTLLGNCMEITSHLPIHFWLHGEKWTMSRFDTENADIVLQTNEKDVVTGLSDLVHHVAYHYVDAGDFAEDGPIVNYIDYQLSQLEKNGQLTGNTLHTIKHIFLQACNDTRPDDIQNRISLFQCLHAWMGKLDIDYRRIAADRENEENDDDE